MTTINEQEFDEIVARIKNGGNIEISSMVVLGQIHSRLASDPMLRGKTIPYAVIFGETATIAIVIYPNISRAKIRLKSSVRISEHEITLALDNPTVVGNTRETSIVARIKEEAPTLIIAMIVCVTFVLVVSFSTKDVATSYSQYLARPNSYPLVGNLISFYESIGGALITILTLFLTVFVLFTISQSTSLSIDKNLFKTGLLHKYFRDDKYISFVSTLALIATIAGVAMTAFPGDIFLSSLVLNKLNFWIPLLYGIAFGGLVICFGSLSYYARRVMVANESNLVKEILAEQMRHSDLS